MSSSSWRTPLVVLIAGIFVGVITTGIRHSLGLYLKPMTEAYGWGREVFAFAMAAQSLMWGLAAPVMGMIAERYGSGRVIFAGGLLYALGLYLTAISTTPLMLLMTLGILIALGVSAAGFSVPLGVVGRAAGEQRRVLYIGIFMAGGSTGMFMMLPISQALITGWGWQQALTVMALLPLAIPLLAFFLREEPTPLVSSGEVLGPVQAVRQAAGEPRFWLTVLYSARGSP